MTDYVMQARHFPSRLPLKRVAACFPERAHSESPLELVYKWGDTSYAFIFNFGTMVFFNVRPEIQMEMVRNMQPLLQDLNPKTTEDFTVEIAPDLTAVTYHEIGFNKVKVKELKYNVLRLLALVIAESAALDYFEDVTEDLLVKSRKISFQLKNEGKTAFSMKNMLKFIGEVLTTKQDIISDLYVVDAPDETWDDQMLDRLYMDMKRLFEIETRYRVLDFKLKLVQDVVEVVSDLLRFRQETLLEMIVIALIGVEILWFFLEYIKKAI